MLSFKLYGAGWSLFYTACLPDDIWYTLVSNRCSVSMVFNSALHSEEALLTFGWIWKRPADQATSNAGRDVAHSLAAVRRSISNFGSLQQLPRRLALSSSADKEPSCR